MKTAISGVSMNIQVKIPGIISKIRLMLPGVWVGNPICLSAGFTLSGVICFLVNKSSKIAFALSDISCEIWLNAILGFGGGKNSEIVSDSSLVRFSEHLLSNQSPPLSV